MQRKGEDEAKLQKAIRRMDDRERAIRMGPDLCPAHEVARAYAATTAPDAVCVDL